MAVPEDQRAPINPTAFRNNPIIKQLSPIPKWTISTADKKPVNAKTYLQTHNDYALYHTDADLVKLSALDKDTSLQHHNRAFRMSAHDEQILLIDVEPIADKATNDDLLSYPIGYAEHSMHGGYHLLMPIPSSLINDKNMYLFNLTALKGPKKMYELLLNNHFVTFTQRVLPIKQPDYKNPQTIAKLKEFLQRLVDYDAETQKARESALKIKLGHIDAHAKLTKDERILLHQLAPKIDELKTIDMDRYANDYSRYEFGMASRCLYACNDAVHAGFNSPPVPDGVRKNTHQKYWIDMGLLKPLGDYNNNDIIQLAYQMLRKVVNHREKHDTLRDGMPWLLYNVKRVAEMGNVLAPDDKDESKATSASDPIKQISKAKPTKKKPQLIQKSKKKPIIRRRHNKINPNSIS